MMSIDHQPKVLQSKLGQGAYINGETRALEFQIQPRISVQTAVHESQHIQKEIDRITELESYLATKLAADDSVIVQAEADIIAAEESTLR